MCVDVNSTDGSPPCASVICPTHVSISTLLPDVLIPAAARMAARMTSQLLRFHARMP